MPHRPTQPPDRQQPEDRPVSPPPPVAHNPWNFLVTRKTTPAVEVMTKREAFAAMAMQGILSNPVHTERIATVLQIIDAADAVAQMAVETADALLAELAKGTKS